MREQLYMCHLCMMCSFHISQIFIFPRNKIYDRPAEKWCVSSNGFSSRGTSIESNTCNGYLSLLFYHYHYLLIYYVFIHLCIADFDLVGTRKSKSKSKSTEMLHRTAFQYQYFYFYFYFYFSECQPNLQYKTAPVTYTQADIVQAKEIMQNFFLISDGLYWKPAKRN